MKKILNYLPYFLYALALVAFILPVVYEKNEYTTINYNMMELIFGAKGQEFSAGLFICFILFITSFIFSITVEKRVTNFRLSMAVIPGLVSGILFLCARLLANPSVTYLKISFGLIVPGILIIHGAILLFINKRILTKNA